MIQSLADLKASATQKGNEVIYNIFKEEGYLKKYLKLEYRPEQTSMASYVAGALEQTQTLLFEAGTGVGKSIAYLIPCILQAIEEGRPCLVSTHTKALQEQILNKDLKLCKNLFSQVPELNKYEDFNTLLLVGRANYLCPNRLAQALSRSMELFPSAEQLELMRIAGWASKTQTGLLEELNPQPSPSVWDWVNADAHSCNRKHCSPHKCFYQHARSKIKDAQIIILNHSLLFSLINTGSVPPQDTPGVLFPGDFLVVDEAHTLPNIASDHFGIRISSFGIERALKMLYHPKRKKGLLSYYGHPSDAHLITDALLACEIFFANIHDTFLQKANITRLHEADWTNNTLHTHLKQIVDRISSIISTLDSDGKKDDLENHRLRFTAYMNHLSSALSLQPDDHVHWLEKSCKIKPNVTIRSAPIDVAPYLEKALFTRHTPVILTSATLAVHNSMQLFSDNVGTYDYTECIQTSPFDYASNTRIYIATDTPAPTKDSARLNVEYLKDMIHFCTEKVRGGSLVLFTSYYDMYQMAEAIRPITQRPFFVQGEDFSRSELAQLFYKAGNAILLGTDSFWTGIDIPGPALSQVIITRIPFENPSHPIKKAKSEYLENRGKNPFYEMTLPNAIIQFRQGLGRLIRKKDDMGTLTILDSRILNKTYGKYFIEALPQPNYLKINSSNKTYMFEPMEA